MIRLWEALTLTVIRGHPEMGLSYALRALWCGALFLCECLGSGTRIVVEFAGPGVVYIFSLLSDPLVGDERSSLFGSTDEKEDPSQETKITAGRASYQKVNLRFFIRSVATYGSA